MTAPARSPAPLVAVLDDDTDLAHTVARLLARHGFPATPFTAPAELLATLDSQRFDCVVSDIQMGEMDGFAFADRLRAADGAVALVFMTAWPTTSHAVDAVRRHGGLDYLEKPIDEERLVGAVCEGLAWSARERRIASATAELSRRERDVFDLLVRGHSNKEVGERLGISARTVEDHRAAIVAKTRTNGLAQLIALNKGETI
ncbi:response regulator transcription factor [Novosphingobium aerophilum]|uniref:response regulator transcription factor n=1 Tax=Novosphingobium TaxID=165696 RepID=UPI0006C85475|nr:MULTISPECIES: response regulator [unclassified Novosphingobium]KPH58099.1 response regulator receiver protein [Novosphingobium sp. ST904]MPS68029.1 response regulator [Novosphingobium sp.]TCM41455.1 two-component system response regulator TtrR [Novosphingobium sp. ST904]WRT95396.1 response regulator [Novosphingobium sp. RL4]